MMRRILAGILLVLIITFIPCISLAETVEVPVKNGDFGLWNVKKGLPEYFDKFTWKTRAGLSVFKQDKEVILDSPQSLFVQSFFPNDARVKINVDVQSDKIYRITCMVRTEDIGNDYIGANISIFGTSNVSNDFRGTTAGWKLLEFYGKTTNGQKSMIVTLGIGGHSNLNYGKAWFNGFKVEQIDELPAGKSAVDFFSAGDIPETWLKGASNGIMFWFAFIIAIILLSILIIFLILNIRKIAGKDRGLNRPELPDPPFKPVRMTRRDLIIISVMTALYLAVAFYKLGSTNVPKTYWEPVRIGESITIDFDKKIDVARFSYYIGLGDGSFTLLARDGYGEYEEIKKIGFNEFDNCFNWNYQDVSFMTDSVILRFDTFNAQLYEVGFFEKDSQTAYPGMMIAASDAETLDYGKPSNIIDELKSVKYLPSFMTGTYFDEIYHARTAYEILHGLNPYETTHPPLGKIIISLGIALFGMNPFGWRLMGMLFGAAMIPIMYAFGKKIFKTTFAAFLCGFLMMFDFMHFTQTRIATIDSYAVLFIILMYYFMYDYFVYKSYGLGFKRSLKALFFTGLFFGLGAAAKWISIYAAAGLAIIFFLTKFIEYRQYMKTMNPRPPRPPKPPRRKWRKRKADLAEVPEPMRISESGASEILTAAEPDAPKPKYAWTRHYVSRYFNLTLVLCLVFLIVIPVIIYLASYIPYLQVEGNTWKSVWDNQVYMYKYHSKDVLSATHDFASPWWSWPLLGRPMWFYDGKMLNDKLKETIVTMGNPAIWWFGIVAFFGSIVISIKKRDPRMIPIYVAIICQYVPWIFIKRVVFIYHFFSTVPFMIITIVYFLLYFWEKQPVSKVSRTVIVLYLIFTAGLFVMFYPAISGATTTVAYVTYWLRWLPTWYF